MKANAAQKRCIEETYGHPSALVAGAGSGKTATLTQRIAYALTHPDVSGVNDIDQILAITYTKKAAGELRSRVKAELASQGLAEQALKVDGAWISTIHGMCSRMLKENAFVLGIDPSFTVASENQVAQLLDAAADEVLAGARQSDDGANGQAVLALIEEYPRDRVKDMLIKLTQSALSTDVALEQFFVPMPTGTNDYLATLVGYAQEVLSQVADQSGKTIDAWREGTDDALRQALALVPEPINLANPADVGKLSAVPLEQQLSAINAFPKPNKNLKAFKNATLTGTDLPVHEAYFNVAAGCRMAIGAEHLRTLLALVEPTMQVFGEKKRALGLIDNDEMIVQTLRMLKDPANAAIRARYENRFKLVMVDEFQDTNQMQVDLINLVAGGSADHLSERMCVVGDAQQSIYRFRNADLAVFQDYVDRLRTVDADQCIEMGTNYRSHAEILAFCKGAFAGTFGDGYLDLLHGRDEARATATAPFRGAQGEPTEENAADPRRINVKAVDIKGSEGLEVAAASIADDFARLIELGHEPGDMVILLGRMTNANLFARELSLRNIPCAVTGGSTFQDIPEVNMVLALLDALVDMEDTQALATVLSGGMFELCPADMAYLVPGSRWKRPRSSTTLARQFAKALYAPESLMDQGEVPNELACALDVLGRAASQVGTRSLSAIVSDVMAQSGWLSRMQGSGKEQVANAMKAVHVISDIEKTQHLDGRSLAIAVRDSVQNTKRAPGVLSAQGDNFVRIMTIHASKGLQFPIVAVADAFPPTESHGKLTSVVVDGRAFVALDAGESIAGFKSSELVQSAWKEIRGQFDTKEEARKLLDADMAGRATCDDPAEFTAAVRAYNLFSEKEEHQRKLYVAYTRARDCLIVTYRYDKKAVENDDAVSQVFLEKTLCGEGNTFTNGEDSGYSRAFYTVHTSYEQAPENDLDWIARVEVLRPEPDEEASDAEDGAFADENEDVPEEKLEEEPENEPVFLVPTHLLPKYTDVGSYGLNWASGILSASSIKARKHAEEAEELPFESQFLDENDQGAVPDEPLASATEKGTAFHALGEYTARALKPGGMLAMPPQDRIDAITRAHGLSSQQRDEVRTHFESWIESDMAKRVAAHAHMHAEEPFWLQIDAGAPGCEPLVMQGFIDVLAYDNPGAGDALVIDYKTGYSLDTDEKRRAAYEVQAKTYAYAVLSQGFASVKLAFVFVEQRDGEGNTPIVEFPAPGEPPYDREALRAELASLVRD